MSGDQNRKIVWLFEAKDELRKLITFIKNDSPQNATKVKQEVLKKISELGAHPERHAPDKYNF
jgi:plasmid stabilization system protein ParE